MIPIPYVLLNFDYEASTGVIYRVLSGGVRKEAGSYTDYLRVMVDGKLMLGHRVIWAHYYREQPPQYIDHIDRDKTNNKISNLRACTLSQNQRNRKVSSNNTTGLTGVTYVENRGKFKSVIYHKSKPIYLGLFENKNDAYKAYLNKKALINEMD